MHMLRGQTGACQTRNAYKERKDRTARVSMVQSRR